MKKFTMILMCAFFSFALAGICKANLVYSLDVFTQNGIYAESSDIDIYCQVDASDMGVNFTFHNDSTVNSSIAQIYFDDSGLLAYRNITNGTGTSFTKDAHPRNLPAGDNLSTPFVTDFSFGAKSPSTKNGINPGQWLTIGFNYAHGASINDVINALNDNTLRAGVHLTGLPDGSSEAAVTVPEPASLSTLAFGLFLMTKKRKRN